MTAPDGTQKIFSFQTSLDLRRNPISSLVSTQTIPPPPQPPAGWTRFTQDPRNWTPVQNSWPLLVGPISVDAQTGETTITGAPQWSLDDSVFPDLVENFPDFSIKVTDMGAIVGANGRTYELMYVQIQDDRTGQIKSFYNTWEGGSGGGFFSDSIGLISRIVTDVSTFGTSEIADRLASAAGVPKGDITIANEAYAAAAVAALSAGAATVLTAPAGATAATGAAFPTAADAGSATASLILPVTPEVAAEAAAGSTLLPASLSLTPALSLDAVSAAIQGISEGAVAPAASVPAATSPSAVGATASAVGGTLEKAAQATVVSTAVTALGTEIKKITGQLPGAKSPSQAASTAAAQVASKVPAGVSNTTFGKWIVGAVAAVALLGKKS